ncbi:LOW QUALITY PROTEIN: hypothetical protein U9M48_030466 [Paspalum notatum var. saurae]|uniref:Uncharacterized protein n=1 Tax=Paspalum notatum var. saurae TaxID=547442 RepID=A0AAQ3U341_PASNO
MGTPAARLSSAEFQPQCVTKPPMAACARISRCGAHRGHTRPRCLVRSKNPAGRMAARSPSVNIFSPRAGGPRSTHRKRRPLRSRAAATSPACSAVKNRALPKHRNTTERGGCECSHRTHSFLLRRWWCRRWGGVCEDRPDGVHRRGADAARALAVGDGREDAWLELRDGVDDEAGRFHVAPAVVDEPLVGRDGPVDQPRREAGRRHGREPGHVHRLPELGILAATAAAAGGGCLVVERRGAQQERAHGGAADEVHVGGHAQAVRRVQQRRAEEVDHDGGDRAQQAGDGRTHVGCVLLHAEGDELLGARVARPGPGGRRRRRRCGEVEEADAEAGRLRVLFYVADMVGDLGRPFLRRCRHDQQREREGPAAASRCCQQPLAGLDHGDEVPDAPHWNQHHGRLDPA